MVDQVYRLSDVINLIGGGTPKRTINEYWDGDIPWLSVKDFNHGGRYVEESDETITQLGLEKSSTKLLKPGMLIISARGTVGELAQLKSEMAFNQSCYGIDAKTNYLNNDYLYYLLKLKIRELKSIAHGSVFDTITRNTFENIEVEIPSKHIQTAIAHILGTLDDKVELNQKMNQTLEDIAKAIFKSWFVDFDPVRAKMEGRPTGLPPEIDELFPDELVDSEIGEIPKGWKVKTISDLADCVGGATPSTKNPEFWEGGHHTWTSPKDLSDSKSIHLLKTDRKITEAGLKKISSGLLPIGTVLLSSRAPVGYLALTTEPTAINQGYIALKPKGGISNYFLLHWCESNLDEIKNRASGTTFAEISKAAFRPIPAIEPSDLVMQKFHEFMAPIYERVLVSSKEMETLAELRDTLLPRLISGELRIPDAKKFLEEAGI